MNGEARRAYNILHRAVASGKLVKPDKCELCKRGCKHIRLSGHHYKGYDHALDVWWICQRCNKLLSHRHDNSLTINQAREIVTSDFLAGFCLRCQKEMVKNTPVLVREHW